MSKDHGRFIWCELMTPDVAGATRFYGAVVGWTAHELPGPDGVYTRVEADGEYGDRSNVSLLIPTRRRMRRLA